MVQVGRTGVLTPRAIVAPVHLAGTTVTAATLHNQDFITEKDIRIGDTVKIRKAGRSSPEILEVELDKRPADAVPYQLPSHCPVCGAPVVRDEDGVAPPLHGRGMSRAAEPQSGTFRFARGDEHRRPR